MPRPTLPALAMTAALAFAVPAGAQETAADAASRPFTVFMLVKTQDAFLALSPADRLAWVEDAVVPILRDHPDVSIRFFDSEFYNADVTDIVVWETTNLDAYQSAVERLRETSFWGPYFAVQQIVPARENAFADFYGPSGAVTD